MARAVPGAGPEKVVVQREGWDRLFAPSSCLAMITTIDATGAVNAASFGTCVRVCHDPVFLAFTVGAGKDTYENVVNGSEFTVNLPPFAAPVLEKAVVLGVAFPPGVNELEKAGLTPLPALAVLPPRIAECNRHFECRVEWTRQWLDRLMVVGEVVAASADADCVDGAGRLVWERARPAHYCGWPYGHAFVRAYETLTVENPYTGVEASWGERPRQWRPERAS
jgi:flavin reductase (DIM6/NTAB) family NADH-FMN oxidoreductase RutF